MIDLRNNPGGVLQAAVALSDLFIKEGIIVYTEGRIQTSATRFIASGEATVLDVPLVILINGGSASASEIVAGALQDHKRAIVLGTTSFGKGSVQSVIPLSETHGMKLTTARYFTPNGRSIQAQGIVPDIIVERGKFTPLKSRVQVTEADLPRHLQNGGTDNADQADTKNSKRTDTQKAVTNDAQLHEAITLLKGLHILSQRGSQPTISANSDDS